MGDAPWWLVGRAAGRGERGDARVLAHHLDELLPRQEEASPPHAARYPDDRRMQHIKT